MHIPIYNATRYAYPYVYAGSCKTEDVYRSVLMRCMCAVVMYTNSTYDTSSGVHEVVLI